jgi:hypothetical protein
MTLREGSDQTPKVDPSKPLSPAEAKRKILGMIGEKRGHLFEIPNTLPSESDEHPALLGSSDEREAFPKIDEDDLSGSDDGIGYLLEENETQE